MASFDESSCQLGSITLIVQDFFRLPHPLGRNDLDTVALTYVFLVANPKLTTLVCEATTTFINRILSRSTVGEKTSFLTASAEETNSRQFCSKTAQKGELKNSFEEIKQRKSGTFYSPFLKLGGGNEITPWIFLCESSFILWPMTEKDFFDIIREINPSKLTEGFARAIVDDKRIVFAHLTWMNFWRSVLFVRYVQEACLYPHLWKKNFHPMQITNSFSNI